MKRAAISALLVILTASIAAAQMMPGGGMHRGSNPPGGSAGSMTPMAGMENSLVVGTDGVLYVVRNVLSATSTPAGEVVAIRPSGTIAWTAKLQSIVHRVEFAGSSVLVATGPAMGGMGRWPAGGALTSSVVALSAASGAVVWQTALDGVVTGIEPFATGTYVLIHVPNVSSATMSVKRSVVAIDNAGKVIWKVELD